MFSALTPCGLFPLSTTLLSQTYFFMSFLIPLLILTFAARTTSLMCASLFLYPLNNWFLHVLKLFNIDIVKYIEELESYSHVYPFPSLFWRRQIFHWHPLPAAYSSSSSSGNLVFLVWPSLANLYLLRWRDQTIDAYFDKILLHFVNIFLDICLSMHLKVIFTVTSIYIFFLQ